MNNISKIKKYFVILTGLIQINFSNQVGIQPDDFVYCYPGTRCSRRAIERQQIEWGGECKYGANQSPIDLPAAEEVLGTDSIPFNRNSHNKVKEFIIHNTGHTILIRPNYNVTREIYECKEDLNSGLNDVDTGKAKTNNNVTYIFAQAHFHWGPNNSVGSEHTINGKPFSMEMHLVHFSSKYETIEQAGKSKNDPSALAVIAIFFDAADDHPDSPLLAQINAHMPLEHPEEDQIIPFSLQCFIPKSGATFYRYHGSLTTPACNEFVLWHVFNHPFKISTHDMDKFRLVTDHLGDLTERNYRNTQLGNLRPIHFLKLE